MPSSFGYRARTRHLFKKGFRLAGMPALSTYLKTYKVGDIVDIKANSAIQKGMPFKSYHGKTGRVFNISPHAVGIIVNKRVNTRIIAKKIYVRIEHVAHSKCRQDFLNRVKENEKKKKEATAAKIKLPADALKRHPRMPREGAIVSGAVGIETIQPLKHVDLF
jgi:large subunit ribosomal protein L21e